MAKYIFHAYLTKMAAYGIFAHLCFVFMANFMSQLNRHYIKTYIWIIFTYVPTPYLARYYTSQMYVMHKCITICMYYLSDGLY